MIQDRIHYGSAKAYEEHFLELFGQSVVRRTGPGAAILAELSGGMDSSSIVCMSDTLRLSHRVGSSDELLDTVSLYDDREPAWDEKPYFSLVEKRRGKVGVHVDASRSVPTYEPLSLSRGLPLLPGADSGTLKFQDELEEQIGGTHRVLLSGVGGDELLGGVPSGMPELADLLVAGNLRLLLKRSVAWCLVDRSPLVMMLSKTAKFAIRPYQPGCVSTGTIPDWVTPQAREMCPDATLQSAEQMRRIGRSPSTIDNGLTWWTLLESLPHLFPSHGITRREHRYPYLDRELVEFLFRVPRHILVNPGRRRTLMRSALKDIVPSEILERRRKAYVVRRPLSSLQEQHEKLQSLFSNPRLADYGLITSAGIRSALRSVADGQGVRLWPSLVKSISFELWLRSEPSLLSS
jgi:asparagine synthase (glutamine-hydrolysing)